MSKAIALGKASRILQHDRIQLGHGSGGKLTHELIEKLFRGNLLPPDIKTLNDSSVFVAQGRRLAMTTDSFVVNPLFFPGGDIGKLAVNGTINDLAVSGASPAALSAAFIIEEGFAVSDLEKIVQSMKEAVSYAGVSIITGDTKVVNRGSCDKIFINTTGIGTLDRDLELSADKLTAGDCVIINGEIGAHGMAVLSAREEIDFESPIYSDTQPLHFLVEEMLAASNNFRCMRDLTRGGLASALKELSIASNVGICIEEEHIPIQSEVKGACEVLGLDPLHVANEGKLIAVVAREDAEIVLQLMRKHHSARKAAIIGEVIADYPQKVIMKTLVGGRRIIEMPTGEQLPRIC